MRNIEDRLARLSPAQRALFEKRLKGESPSSPKEPAIPRRKLAESYPLSMEQEQVWFHCQLASDVRFYHIARGYRIKGPLNVALMERTVNEIIQRHENLRTTFHSVNNVPTPVIAPSLTLKLVAQDLSDWAESEREAEMLRRFSRAIHEPFDLARGPLIRLVMLRLSEREHALLQIMHHLITDRLSSDVFLREARMLYAAFSAGQPSSLSELPIQYGDFACWQRQRLQGKVLEDHLSFWKSKLADPPTLALPTDWPRPPAQSHAGGREQWMLQGCSWEKFKIFMLAENTTRFMGLLAVHATLLHRYTGQDNILLGSPISNRDRTELAGLIGYLINMIVLRIDLSGNPTFRELLGRVRATSLEALAHQEVPIGRVVRELHLKHDASRNPLFQATYIYTNSTNDPVSHASELAMTPLNVFYDSAFVDLSLGVDDAEELCMIFIDYRTDLFDKPTIKRMARHYQMLLESVMANPDSRIGEIPMLTEPERRQLVGWSETRTSYPVDACVHDLFEAQAIATPEAIALVYESEHLTYFELNERADQLARRLRSLGVGPEVRVGILLERSTELVVSVLAVLKAGGAYVPLDPLYPPHRIAFMLADAAAGVLLTQRSLAGSLQLGGVRVLCLDDEMEEPRGPAAGNAQSEAQIGKENPATGVSPENLAYIIYTSGSTGSPKGVMVTHANVVRLFAATREWFHFSAEDAWTLFHSYAFDFSVWELWGALLHGGRLVIVPYWVSRSPEAFSELLADERITVLNQTPSAFQQLSRAVETKPRHFSLRLVIFGGEALELQNLRTWFERYGDECPRLVNMYGITETTVHVTYRPITASDAEEARGSRIGCSIPDLQVFVLDDHLQPAPVGVAGEVYVAGAGLARGYLGRPELTAERFVPDPFSRSTGERLYRTGDLALWRPGGDLEHLGRADQQVKIRGFRIELGEIEAALAALETVRAAVVVTHAGEGGDRGLVAYVVAAESVALTVGELRHRLAKRLPEYMIPSAFVFLEAIPLTPNGKLDRQALPAFNTALAPPGGGYVAPRTPIEEMVADIWAEVLGLNRVGADDDFFELGGHSLLATQVISRLHNCFNLELPLRTIFEQPSVAALAAVIEAGGGRGEEARQRVTRASRDQPLPLSYAQLRMWFLHQLEPNSAAYNVAAAVRLRGSLDSAAFERSFAEVLRRHEVLRTTFAEVEGRPRQVISAAADWSLTILDLSAETAEQAEQQARALAADEAARPFDLARGPLLRATLLRLHEDEHVLLLTMHHIVADQWSMGVLVRELGALYEAYRRGHESPLPELAVQYADYASWQPQWLSGEVLEKQLSYWRQQLQGAPALLELPTDRPRPAIQTFRGASFHFTLPTLLGEALRELSRREGVTLFMTVLAAFQILLHRYSGQDDICVGFPIANRTRAETEDLIGFFANTLVLRSRLDHGIGFRQFLRQVRETALNAYAHQDLPFERLVEELQPERSLSHQPLFQVMLTWQNAPQPELQLSGLRLEGMAAGGATAKFDLNLLLTDGDAGIGGTLEYSTDLFEPATARRLLADLEALLANIVADPDQSISEDHPSRSGVTIAVTATFTAEPIADSLAFWLQELGMPSGIKFAPYNQIFQQLLDPSSLLSTNSQGVNVVLVRPEDWLRFGADATTETDETLERNTLELAAALRTAAERAPVPYFVFVCAPSPASPERALFYAKLEDLLISELEDCGGVHLVTSVELSRAYPAQNYYDAHGDQLGHVPYTAAYYAALGTMIARKIHSLRSVPYKVIVLDCDQTLWQGVCAEDGTFGVNINASHRALQEFVLAQQAAGMILSLCSKNSEADVFDVFERRPEMLLKRDHLVAWRINWELKSENLKSLAEELGLGLDTFIFIDDDPVACAEVQANCPEVLVLQYPLKPDGTAGWLERVWAFDRLKVTAEDRQRTTLYHQHTRRERTRRDSLTFADFLAGLDLKIIISAVAPQHVARVSQLTERTNQFNSTTVRYSEADIRNLLADQSRECLVVEVSDRFGDYGLVGVVIFETTEEALDVTSFLLSCRVLGRNVEHAVLRKLGGIAQARGRAAVNIHFRPTDKNQPVRNFLETIQAAREEPAGICYRFPAALAAAVAYHSAEADQIEQTAVELSAARGSKASDGAHRSISSARLCRIASELFSVEQVLAAVDAGRRRSRLNEETFVAARTPYEEMLAGIWEEILGVNEVGVNDNFFKLGGHSLLAMQVVARLRHSFNLELPLRTIFEQPTVAGLAAVIETGGGRGEETRQQVTRVRRDQPLPLSYAQLRMWFLTQLEPHSPAYNLAAGLRLRGALDVAALERSLGEVILRHEVLRTAFAEVDGRPVQLISEYAGWSLPLIDLRDEASEEPDQSLDERVNELAAAEAARPFDLACSPLLRANLLRLSEDEHVLLLTMHHIVSDGWSIGVLVRELGALYEAFSRGRESPLRELILQYADYASWQRQWLSGEVLAKHQSYWQKQLEGAPTELELPTDLPRPAIQTFRGLTYGFDLPADLADELKKLSRREGSTLFMSLLAGFSMLLSRYTGQDDLIVGTAVANREQAATEDLIGMFFNTLPLRVDLSGSLSFVDLLRRVRETALGAYTHQALPFEKLIDELQLKRDTSLSPLVQVMLILQNVPVTKIELPGLTMTSVAGESRVAKLDLILSIAEDAGALRCALEYNTDLFKPVTIARLAGHFQTILEGVVADPHRRLREYPMLTATERSQLSEWKETRAGDEQNDCIHELFERQTQRAPNLAAVSYEETRLTYAELNRRANQLARHLRALGVGPEVRVGIYIERGAEMVVGLLGILKAGGAYVPMDVDYPRERLSFMLTDARVGLLLTKEVLLPTLPSHQVQTLCLDSDWEAISQQSDENLSRGAQPENLAYVIYTSGSTGQPKGVMVSHRNVAHLFAAIYPELALDEREVWTLCHSYAFDFSVWEIWGALLHGGELVIVPQWTTPESFYELLETRQVTVLSQTPSAFRQWWTGTGSGTSRISEALALRLIILGGEALPADIADELSKTGIPAWNFYGPTEATVWALIHQLDSSREVPHAIGCAIPNMQSHILDRHGMAVPVGVPGELHLSGEGLSRGYFDRPELTAEKFIPHPFGEAAGARLYRTGDLARYLSDGRVEYLGRIDEQVKLRGYRIEPGEIEIALSRYQGVRQAVVSMREDVPGEKRLVAYIVWDRVERTEFTPPPASALRTHLSRSLPDYMLPAVFVELEQLPLTPNGKIDRRVLPAPDRSRPELDKAYVEARTAAEALLVEIWKDVLGIERVGVHDNFFELGGHSLLATQVMSRVRVALGADVALRVLFESPTIEALAQQVEAARHEEHGIIAPPIIAVSRTRPLPLSFAQQRLWFLDQLEPGSAVYNVPAAVRMKGELNLQALAQTLSEAVRRHEVLRTTFAEREGEPVQLVGPAEPLELEVMDLSESAPGEREQQVRELAQSEAERPFDLAVGPLFRVKLLRLSEDEHIVLLTMHHIVSDAWSMELLVNEVAALYQAYRAGERSPLAELAIQYADYAAWQRKWLQGEVLERQLAYWKQQLEGAPALLELPTDHPRPAVQSFKGATQSFVFPPRLSAALKELSRHEGSTPFMLLLAAVAVLLSRYTEQDDICVGAPLAGRTHPEIEGLVGLFVNTLVLRVDVSGDPSFRELLQRILAVTLDAHAHQDVPFERLVEELQPERSLSHQPLFQVMLDLHMLDAEAPAAELELSMLAVERTTVMFDLMFSVFEIGDGAFSGGVEYSTSLFETATIERLIKHWQRLLESAVADPELKISQLAMLAEAETTQFIEWNATHAAYPEDKCVHELFEERVRHAPGAIAVTCGNESLTYAELNARANRVAHALSQHGIGPESLVALFMERNLDLLAAMLGVFKAGGVYLPLDPRHPVARQQQILAQSRAQLIVSSDKSAPQLEALLAGQTETERPPVLLVEELLRREHADENLATRAAPVNLAYVIYTSGSTGKPKGAMIEHRGMLNHLCAKVTELGLIETDVVAQTASQCFDISVWQFLAPLIAGGRVHICTDEVVQDPVRLLDEVEREGVTVLEIVPSLLGSAFESVMTPGSAQQHLSRLRRLILTGEALPPDLCRRWIRAYPKVPLLNAYGPTECSDDVTHFRIEELPEDVARVPIGRPIGNTRAYVFDKHQRRAPVGVWGELHIAGAGVGRGYLDEPGQTAQAFIPDPFSAVAGSRLYKTGDVARFLADGSLEYFGRVDGQVKVRGFRIELGEIEAVLNGCAGVRDAAVVAAANTDGDAQLFAYIVLEADEPLLVTWLSKHLRDRLPHYMIPSAFITLDQMPLTPNGKLDRRALPAPDFTTRQVPFVAPQTGIEEIQARLWSEVLKVSQVGIDDNFFELGGHSLSATRLVFRLSTNFGVSPTLAEFFAAPTIRATSEWIESALISQASSSELDELLDALEKSA